MRRMVTTDEPNSEFDVVVCRGGYHRIASSERRGHRFLGEDMLAGVRRVHSHRAMHKRRRSDKHRANLVIGEQFVVI